MIKIICQTGEELELSLDGLESADLSRMALHRAIFTNRAVSGTSFVEADLRGALFDGADMRKCDLHRARLMNALFLGADLRGANLKDAALVGSVLDGADLRDADLTGADVAFASFKGTDVRGAILLCKRLFEADVRELISDSSTIFPEGFKN